MDEMPKQNPLMQPFPDPPAPAPDASLTQEVTGKEAMQFRPQGSIGGISGYGGIGGYGGYETIGEMDSGWQGCGGGYGGGGGRRSPTPGLLSNFSLNGLPMPWPFAYRFYRMVLDDPTVRMVRAMAYSPILATKWNIESTADAPSDAADAMQSIMEDLRINYINDSLRGIDYGWAPFELVYAIENSMFVLRKAKPLLHDFTGIFVDEHGEFAGLNNNGITLGMGKAHIFTYDSESGNLYGRGRALNLLKVMAWWDDANEGAAQYDRKVAGVFLVCHYPPGQSIDRNGETKENWKIAQEMLNAVAAGHPIAVCNEFAGMIEDNLRNADPKDRTRWRLEILEDKGSRQPGFKERLTYLDMLKARGMQTPERAVLEAQRSGSRADSESHSDVVLLQSQLDHASILQPLNGRRQDRNSPVNTILRMNWGDKAVGTVRVVPSVIADDLKKFYRDVVKEFLSGYPQTITDLTNPIELFEQAGLPLPTEPMDSAELAVKLEGMTAMKLPNSSKQSLPPEPKDAAATLARIHEGMRLQLNRLAKVNGHSRITV